jgi:heme/copper-type cytochrome/quinol oxidase subunit 4
MAPDEVMVYTAMAIVPAVTSIACFVALRAFNRKSISVLASILTAPIALVFAVGLMLIASKRVH